MVAAEVTRRTVARARHEIRLVTSTATGARGFLRHALSKSVSHHGGGAEFGAQKRKDLANWVGDCARAAAGIEQAHRTRRVRRYHQRSGIAGGAEGTAIDYHLIAEGGGKRCSSAAGSGIVHLHTGADRSQGGAGKAGAPATLSNFFNGRKHSGGHS